MFPPYPRRIPGQIPRSLTALNLRRLLLLRAGAITGWLLVIVCAAWEFELQLPFAAMLSALALWVVFSAFTWLRLHRRAEVRDRVFFVQLLIDTAILTALLYMSGGSTNPFTLLLLLPLTISAALLPGFYSWIIALATGLCYTLLLYFYIPLPLSAHLGHEDFGLHVIGMWLGFVLSAGLIAGFVSGMGSTLRERDRQLAESRERELRDERIVALGALAAGAAHELGTPLGTIALLSEEIELEYVDTDRADGEALAEKLRILRSQVARCKSTLAMLSLSAGQSQADSGRLLGIDRYLHDLVEEWRALRPGIPLRAELEGETPAPFIVAEQTLSQAIISILNNAADASREGVEISARWTAQRLQLMVCDRGHGVAQAAISAAGKTQFSTKRPGEGLGLGLYLAHSVVDRLGGEILLFNRDGGGACTKLVLPLDQLTVGPGGIAGTLSERDDGRETAAGR